MTIDYDTNGKIFTNIIAKDLVAALIQTTSHFIEGEVHIRQGGRFKDELDIHEPFLAVTNATVLGADHQVLYRTRFIAVRRDQVVWMLARVDLQEEGETC